MKKLLSIILAAVIAASVICVPVYASVGHVNDGDTLVFGGAFADLLDWTGVVFGDVNNVIDVEGTLAVGGSFNSNTGFSANSGAYGQYPASTDNVALLIGNNVNIAGYGCVWGQTVVGNAEGNTYKLSNVMASETANAQYAVANTAQYFADAMNTAYAVQGAIDALPVNGVCDSAYGTYTFVGDPDADVIVYNVYDSIFNSYLFNFTVADGQTVIVNFTTSDKIQLRYGGVSINGSMDPEYLRSFNRSIIYNVPNATQIEMTSCELDGILLAPSSDLNGKGSNVCGHAILNGLTGSQGFELHVGYDYSTVPALSASSSASGNGSSTPADPADPSNPGSSAPEQGEAVSIRIDTPLKMAVAFEDGTVYYGGEMKDVIVGQEYMFRMCAVNWDNGLYDEEGNGLAGTVVYRMVVVHEKDFDALAAEALLDPDRYTVKGIDIIDNLEKKIIVNCDATDTHLETDVNNFFVAYRFHFTSEDYNRKTGIDGVVNTPVESLSVNLPAGTTVTCNAYFGEQYLGNDYVFITTNNGEGVYDDVFLTSVNDYTWAY